MRYRKPKKLTILCSGHNLTLARECRSEICANSMTKQTILSELDAALNDERIAGPEHFAARHEAILLSQIAIDWATRGNHGCVEVTEKSHRLISVCRDINRTAADAFRAQCLAGLEARNIALIRHRIEAFTNYRPSEKGGPYYGPDSLDYLLDEMLEIDMVIVQPFFLFFQDYLHYMACVRIRYLICIEHGVDFPLQRQELITRRYRLHQESDCR